MRLLLVLPVSLLACAALFAGELSELARAVGLFGDDRPEVRRDASTDVARYLRRELAPLLEAMEAPDPEVRRRAAEALRDLLPREPEAPPEPELPWDQVVIVNGAGGGGNVVLRANGQVRFQQLRFGGVPQKDVEALGKFGLEGHAVADETMRRQLRLA